MSGNVREFDSCQGNVRDFTKSQGNKCQGKNLVREKLPKTVYAYLHPYNYLLGVCSMLSIKYMVLDRALLHSYPTTDSNVSTGMI